MVENKEPKDKEIDIQDSTKKTRFKTSRTKKT